MANETANVEILKSAYRRWNDSRGDSVDDIMEICAPDICWGSVARGMTPLEFARECSGRDEMRSYFDGLLADWAMVHYTVDEFIAQGDTVVARGSCAWTNKKTGKIAETPKVDFWRFRDGKAVEFYEYFDTARVGAAAA
jgi:ketosteroid isomerase-like protein